LGAIVASGARETNLSVIMGLIAVVLATINVVGGFLVTDRMLQMFKKKATS
jgi:NAD(P) transhydrogenase subunit alpha